MVFLGETRVFWTHTKKPIWSKQSLSPPWNIMYSFQKLTQFKHGNNVLDAPVSNTDGFLEKIHLFLQVRWRVLFGTKRALLHLENNGISKYSLRNKCVSSTQLKFEANRANLHQKHLSCRKYSFQKTHSYQTRKQWARCLCFEHTCVSFERDVCFFNLVE
jgi:hypothetical protein